jgi:protein arginine kinase activator
MLLCCICKEKEATVHLTQIQGDKVQKVDLCEECAKTKGVNDPTGFSLADLLLGLGASHEIEQAAGGVEIKCPRCGFTQADFKKAGRLGCPDCYRTFSEPLDGLLKTMHKDMADRLKVLQKKLSKAIEGEDFEEAAILRDEIKQAMARMSAPTKTEHAKP